VHLTVTSGSDVIKLKGSTIYAPGAVIAATADAIVTGRNRVMSVSTCLGGEYGFTDVSIGVPAVLGKNGVEKLIELELGSASKERFARSVAAVKEALANLKS
jgi:malate dehydrogenase